MVDMSLFTLTETQKVEMTKHLTPKQAQRARTWIALQETLNRGEFDERMDNFFHPEFTYGNPSRPDLGSYASWKTSPVNLYRVFPPSAYRTKAVTGNER